MFQSSCIDFGNSLIFPFNLFLKIRAQRLAQLNDQQQQHPQHQIIGRHHDIKIIILAIPATVFLRYRTATAAALFPSAFSTFSGSTLLGNSTT